MNPPERKETRLGALYESLARHVHRRGQRTRPGEPLELRKRLLPASRGVDGPADGGAGLDQWLLAQLSWPASGRVLDEGCGFGATLLRFAGARPGHYLGRSPSLFQVERARAAAQGLALEDQCNFEVAVPTTAPAGRFDVILAIESLAHAEDLPAAVARLVGALAPGGTLVIVDDFAADASVDREPEVRELQARWGTTSVWSVAALESSLAPHPWRTRHIKDLTPQVPATAGAKTAFRSTLLRVLKIVPSSHLRILADAFLGGIALERLYARGRMRYLAAFATTARPGG